MIPVQFKEANFTFTKPDNMTDEQCMSLPVFRGKDQGGIPVIISCWKLSKEDLDDINKTGQIYLSIAGDGMPPVSIFTENPFSS